MAISDRNCLDRQIIKIEGICKEAAKEFGLEYDGAIGKAIGPAGCYWKNNKIYFNRIFDASLTTPEKFNGRRGVCKKGMNSVFPLLYLLK